MKKYKDFYFKKAKKENYSARSIYKLDEIDTKYNIIKKNMTVMDLGCAPGSWLEYIQNKIGKNGRALGIDLKEVKKDFTNNIITIKENIYNKEEIYKIIDENPLLPKYFDVIVSDMAPNTTGRKDVDAYKSYELCLQALNIADDFLKYNGNFITKIFQGEDLKNLLNKIKEKFIRYKVFKPNSSRNESVETYIIGWNKK